MKRTRTKTKPLDWIVIQWARACEDNQGVDVSELESQVSDPDVSESGALIDATSYLRDRAELLLSRNGAVVKRWVGRVFGVWLASSLIVLALGALVFPCARVRSILDANVNLAGPFVFFLLGQILCLVGSLIMICVVLFQSLFRRAFHRSRSITLTEKAILGLSNVVGSIVLAILHHVAPVFYRLFGRRTSERFAWRAKRTNDASRSESRDATQRERQVGSLFWDALFSRPRFLFFWGGFLSHGFWASCSFCVLMILVAQMQGNRYNYCWHTSLEDEQVVKKCVDFLATPIVALGGQAPTETDVERLFDDWTAGEDASSETSPRQDASATGRRTQAQTRARWSYFLLSVVFVWCVAPRLGFTAIYFALMRYALRDFRPDLNDDYFQGIIRRAESYRTTTKSEYVPFAENEETEEAPVDAPAKPIWSKPLAPLSVETPPAASQTITTDVAADDVVESQGSAPIEPPRDCAETAPSSCDDSQNAAALVKEESEPETRGETLNPESDAALIESASAESLEPVKSAEDLRRETNERLIATLGDLSQIAPLDREALEDPPPNINLAFGYDATLSEYSWRDLLGEQSDSIILGDVAANLALKGNLTERLQVDGARVTLCALITDVSLSPARHFVIFMRDVLTPLIPNARVVVILSGGELLRQKFRNESNAVSERIDDWTQSLAFMAQSSGLEIVPVFYYDASLDLPESRAQLRRFLQEPRAPRVPREVERDLTKWDAASRAILEHARAIYETRPFVADEELDRRLVAKASREVFSIYLEELGRSATSGRGELRERLGGDSFLGRLSERALMAVDTTSAQCSAVGKSLMENCRSRGLTSDFLEKQLLSACGLSAKMRVFCSKLSPKCAGVAATLGIATPLVVAMAPVLGGAASAATLVGALGSIIPNSLLGGALGGALGATAPLSLAAFRSKLRATLGFSHDEKEPESTSTGTESCSSEVANVLNEDADALSSAAALICATASWQVILELQDRPESEIVTLAPKILQPLEDSPLDAFERAQDAFVRMRALVAEIPRFS